MRTRLVRPEFVNDELLGSLPDPLVLFYVKLWLLCDDEGYFEWKPGQIGAVLYPYRAAAIRTRQVDRWLAALGDVDRVRALDCGVHGVIPTIPTYRIRGGSQSSTYRSHHRSGCLVRTSTYKSVSESVSESVSQIAQARDDSPDNGVSDFQAKVGFPAFMEPKGKPS